MSDSAPQQLLHLVIGGELTDLEHITFKDLDQVDIVGVYPNYASALAAWRVTPGFKRPVTNTMKNQSGLSCSAVNASGSDNGACQTRSLAAARIPTIV